MFLKKKYSAILFLILPVLIGFIYKEKSTIQTPCNYMTTDNLGNIYTVNSDVLSKYYPNGTLFNTYNNKGLGAITYVDATNAMKPLVFYRDFFQLIFLDNTLSPNGPVIDLLSMNFRQPQLVCSSNNNGIWIFDQLSQELYRLNQSYETISKSGNLIQVLGKSINPIYLTEYNNMIYMSDTSLGILAFDIFGNYRKTIPVKTKWPFQVTEEKLYFQSDSAFHSYHFLSFDTEKIVLPKKEFQFVRTEKNLLYIGGEKKISVYEIKQ